MKELDIERYLDGELKGAELEAFETELRGNPDFAQEVQLMRQLTGDLEMQGLREEVGTILKKGGEERGGKSGKGWLGLLAGAALLAVATYFLWPAKTVEDFTPDISTQTEVAPPSESIPQKTSSDQSKTNTNQTNEPSKQTNQPTKQTKPNEPNEQTKPTRNTQPIASAQLPDNFPAPLHPSPTIRGQNNGNEAWKALVDQIWYTEFPPANTNFKTPFAEAAQLLAERKFTKAFVKLEIQERKMPASDTLRFLKAYCLMEMGEGADALRYMERIEKPPTEWQGQLQWYKNLSLLISKGISVALPEFKKLAATSDHPYQLQSIKAVQLLE